MKVAVFDAHKFDREALENANRGAHELCFFETRLNEFSAKLAQGCRAVCCFVNDRADAKTLDALKAQAVELIALRSAGFNNIDIAHAKKLGIRVVYVPEYSPHAVAEHAVALLQTFNRKIHKAYQRVHELNFSLDGLVGFDLYGKTIGVVGTGRIGKIFAQIMKGFGCRVLAHDLYADETWAMENGIQYVDLDCVLKESDVISLHVPLTPTSQHLLNGDTFRLLKKSCIIINTGRGALIDTKALIRALKARTIAGACLDVYEEEAGIFFDDWSAQGIDDDLLARLLTFPNVLMTSHQAFLTTEALKNIATTTIASLSLFENGGDLHEVSVPI